MGAHCSYETQNQEWKHNHTGSEKNSEGEWEPYYFYCGDNFESVCLFPNS